MVNYIRTIKSSTNLLTNLIYGFNNRLININCELGFVELELLDFDVCRLPWVNCLETPCLHGVVQKFGLLDFHVCMSP